MSDIENELLTSNFKAAMKIKELEARNKLLLDYLISTHEECEQRFKDWGDDKASAQAILTLRILDEAKKLLGKGQGNGLRFLDYSNLL